MGGDEAGFPPEAFAPAFRIAEEAGLGLTVHAGEWAGPESVRGGLALGVSRIGHGVRASEDPELVRELADRGTVLEVCPTRNVVLGLYPSYEAHPLRALRDAGVAVTLGSDDPPYWDASIGGEYAVAPSTWASTTRLCGRSLGPRSVRHSSRKKSGSGARRWVYAPAV